MKFRFSAVMLAALMLFDISCSKKSAPPAQQTVDLGVVDLNNGAENRIDLKNGTVCIITPKSVMDGKLMLNMQVEKAGVVVALPRAEATPDQPVSVYLNDFILKLTPHLK
jgi:hypothetical protein